MDSKKNRRAYGAPVEPGTWNLQEPTAEGSRNQNRGTLHGVETSCTHWVHFVPFLRAHPVLARRAGSPLGVVETNSPLSVLFQYLFDYCSPIALLLL